jgi:hypothetical protein
MSSPKMSSLVISATKAQIFSGRHPRVRVRKTSFKMGRASSDTVCSLKRWFGYLSGHPAAMSGLASDLRSGVHCHQARFVADPALGDQTRIGISCDGSQYVIGSFNAYAGVRPSSPALALFPTVCHPSCLFLRCYVVTIQTFLAIPTCLYLAYLHVSGADHFPPSFLRSSYSRSRLALHSSSILILLRLFVGWGGDRFPRHVVVLFLWGLAATSTACSSSACLGALFTDFSPPSSSSTSYVGVF